MQQAGLKNSGLIRFTRDIDSRYLDVLDGFRVCLMFVVSWFHIWQQSWLMPIFFMGGTVVNLDFIPRTGYMMVDGLIFLSGLLMMFPFTKAGAGAPAAWPFYRKRLIRIVPGYLLVVAVSLADALSKGAYRNTWEMIRDLLAHLTFTHSLFPFSYTGSPLNGGLWTRSVEVQFYLLFPLVGRLYQKHPAWTAGCMGALAFLYRAYVGRFQDTSLYINQLPAFLDIYALGFFSATVIRAMLTRLRGETRAEKCFFSGLAAVGCLLIVRSMQAQATSPSIEAIRLGQMDRRFVLGIGFSLMSVGLCFSLPVLRFLFGNRVMAFLSSVSYAFYMWHQMVTLHLKEWGIPPSKSVQPWMDGELSWQWPYVLLCFGISLLISIVVTYLFERPLQRRLSGASRSAGPSAGRSGRPGPA